MFKLYYAEVVFHLGASGKPSSDVAIDLALLQDPCLLVDG
jgi:hypothetical protein